MSKKLDFNLIYEKGHTLLIPYGIKKKLGLSEVHDDSDNEANQIHGSTNESDTGTTTQYDRFGLLGPRQ